MNTTVTKAAPMEHMPIRGGAMRMHSRLWVFALSAIFLANCLHAQEKDAHESLLIARGDLLHVTVLRESDLDQKVRVSDAGDISLPLIGSVQVSDLSPAKAAAAI